MTAQEIIQKVKAEQFPPGSYIVFGSCPLALANLREANDIDMLVSPKLYQELKNKGWKPLKKGPNDIPLIFKEFEAHENWNFSSYKPTLEHLLETATVKEGVPFASLEEVRKWKISSGRPKDLRDVALINKIAL